MYVSDRDDVVGPCEWMLLAIDFRGVITAWQQPSLPSNEHFHQDAQAKQRATYWHMAYQDVNTLPCAIACRNFLHI